MVAPGKYLVVTAAYIVRSGKVFIARRADEGALRGKWEFPGGKMEPGETPQACLARELKEEFGVTAVVGEVVTEVVHHYDETVVHLIVLRVRRVSGRFVPTEHDAMAWVMPEELLSYDLAPADIPVARLLAERGVSRARRRRTRDR